MGNEHDFEILKGLCEKYRNWGKWGPDDQIGTLNYITPEKVVQAAKLVQKGKVFSLSIPFDGNGPQNGGIRRFNPMGFMLRDGRDTLSGSVMGSPQNYGGADDVVMLPTHAATHWDAPGPTPTGTARCTTATLPASAPASVRRSAGSTCTRTRW